jgi:flagellar biosynthetic protein FlhB
MALGDAGERTEPATPKHRFEAKQKGQVLRSQEVSHALIQAAAVAILVTLGPRVIGGMKTYLADTLRAFTSFETTPAAAAFWLQETLRRALWIALPCVLATSVAAAAAGFLQSGFMISSRRLSFDLGRLDPTQGLRRLFSLDSVGRTVASILKLAVLGAVVYAVIRPRLAGLVDPATRDLDATLGSLWELIVLLLVRATAAFLVIAFLDYLFQRWRYEKALMMTRAQIKEEVRSTEGDPAVRRRVRAAQRELARRRMMSDVRHADVVITNPLRYAVALRYDRATMAAPVVLAKGMGHVARRIRKLARRHGVPVVENAPLARALYRTVAVGGVVPVALYRAVAEILAAIYRLRYASRARAGGVPS